MKKIYILTAVFALLTLSLNAQTRASKQAPQPTTSTEKVVTLPDGYFRMGPSRASTTPVTPPYTNSFGSTSEWNWWEAINVNGGNTWTYNSSGYAQYQYETNNAANDWLVTAPVTLEAGKKYLFSIKTWARNSSYPERLEVRMANANTAAELSAGTTVISSTTVTASSSSPLTLYKEVIISETGNYYFGIHAISDADMFYLYVDDLSIGAGVDMSHDLKVYMSEPSQVYAGQTATISAKVTNSGDYDETGGYTVTFKANGTTISTQTVSESLAVGASKMIYVQYPTTEAGTVNFTATVTCASTDADASNNSATATLSVIAVPAPVNVAATDGDHSSTVTWEAPNIAAITVTEDFENTDYFEPFDIGNITATNHTGTIGGWTVYDSTGKDVWPADDVTWPNMGVPQAWLVFNSAMVPVVIEGNSGDQYMESVGPEDGTATNSWLISPELSGEAQTITFYERVISATYAETYQVLYSTTDNNPDSFTALQTITSDATSWTQRSVSLPEGAKYFAIRHTSQNKWLMVIDDITYKVAGEQPVSYNVYLDGVLQGNVDSNTFSYNFSNVEYGEHTCAISAVYADDLKSELVSDTFVSAAKTATPTITYQVTNGTVVITATGDGDITLSADGQTAYGQGTATITIVRSIEDRTVTATATAKEEDAAQSDPATAEVPIPALTGSTAEPAEGLLRLHMLIVDQLKQEIPADNSHPDHYGYVLRYEPTGGEKKESGSVRVDIQKTDCTVEGKYTLDQIDNDKNIGSLLKDENNNIIVNNGKATISHDQGLTMDIYTADVQFMLSETNPDIDFYMLERDISTDNPDAGFSYVTKLQQTTNFTYVEMLPGSAHEGDEYLAGPHYFNDEVLTGTYGDAARYAPVVSTWGLQRRWYEYDGLDNTYGAPLWKTGVGGVTITKVNVVPQDNAWHSVTWTDADGAARLYMLDSITVVGKLPDYSTVKYEPYMFRIFVESPSGKIRNYKVIEGTADQGEHLEAAYTSEEDKYGPRCVWSGYIKDIPETTTENNPYGMTLGITDNQYTFTKKFVDRANGSSNGGVGNADWDKDAVNAMFGALTSIETGQNQAIKDDDLKIFVRFYYNVEGMAAGHEATSNNNRSLRADEETHPGYGVESDAKAPKQTPTSVFEITYHGEVVGQTYYNVQGMESDKPFQGVNIVVTRFSDGTTSVSKVVR